MSAKKKFLITVAAATLIIAIIGAVAAITVSTLGRGASYAFWSEAENVTSTETSNTTALANEYNPSEKYISYEYYLINEQTDDSGKTTEEWTRLDVTDRENDSDNISRPSFSGGIAGVTTNEATGETNIKAVMTRYTGNISTLRVPDATPVFVGGIEFDAEVVSIASLNMENSPGLAVVDKLIIGRNVESIGYSRGINGMVVQSGMFGFYALKEVTVVRNGNGNISDGYFHGYEKISALGHFFEDAPYVERITVVIYSDINVADEVPQKRPVKTLNEIFKAQEEIPSGYIDTGIDATHGLSNGFKLSLSRITRNAENGLPIYKDTLFTEKTAGAGDGFRYTSSGTGGTYTATIEGVAYTLMRDGNGKGVVYNGDTVAGRYEYGAFTVVLTLFETDETGAAVVDELGIEKAKAKYFY